MSNSKPRLGRGLSGLISGTTSARPPLDQTSATTLQQKVSSAKDVSEDTISKNTTNVLGYTELELSSIISNPYQPRREIQPELI